MEENNNITHRFEWVDILRGMAIVSVYLIHSILVYPIDISLAPFFQWLKAFIIPFYMPLFFLIAGYCYRKKPYITLLKERAVRLLVPYFLISTLTSIMNLYAGSLVNGTTNIEYEIKAFILYGGNYWFIYVLFIITLLAPITNIITQKSHITIMVILILRILGEYVKITLFCLDQVMFFYIFFLIGILIHKEISMENIYGKSNIITCICLIIYCIWVVLKKVYQIADNLTMLPALIACEICWFISYKLSRSNLKIKKILSMAGKYSLQFYLLNGYLLVCARVALVQILKVENIYIIYFCIVLSNCLGAMFACEIIRKSKLLSLVFGMKQGT